MLIHWKDIEGNIQVLDVLPSDESECVRGVMEPNTLTLHFSLPYYVNIAAGAYCVFEGERYELVRPQAFSKSGKRKWEYTLTMESAQGLLAKWKVRNTVDGSLEFLYTATPKQHIDLLVEILNSHAEEGGVRWRTGTCIEAAEKLINYNHTQLSEALPALATLFETEFEVTSEDELGVTYATIHFGRVEYNKDAPLTLSYGPNGGLLAGVKRENSEAMAVSRLFVQGTEENITAARYNPLGSGIGSRRLLLPISQELGYDGTYFSDEIGYNEMVAQKFTTSADGQSITLANDEGTVGNEDSLDCTDIIPTKELTITMVEREEATNSEGEKYYNYDIVLSIPQDEDYRDYTVEGEIAYVAFQSGMLAGREFDIHTLNNGVLDIDLAYNNDGFKGWRFKLVGDEMDGYFMPSEDWEPKVGDTVKIFGIQLPESAICDNETRSGASWDMFREAIRVMWERSNTEMYYEGELSQVWVAKYWRTVGAKVRVGGYVRLTDEDFEREGALIRITGVRTYINNKYAPQLTLSNEVVHSGFKSTIAQIKGEEVKNEAAQREVLDFTKRRFRDAKESQAMLAEALIGEFTESLSPIAVNTMQAIVGSTTLQYTFVQGLEDMTTTTFLPQITPNDTIVLPQAFIKHETLGISEVKPEREYTEYMRWQVEGDTLAFENSEIAYYLYIRADKASNSATFILSPSAIHLEEEVGYFHFLLATISRQVNGSRSYQSWNGFTEVTPGAIRANRYTSTDGQQYVDFDSKEFRVGDASKWIEYKNGDLEVKGALIGENVLGQAINALDSDGNIIAGLSGREDEPLIFGLVGNGVWYQWQNVLDNEFYYTRIAPSMLSTNMESIRIYAEPYYDSFYAIGSTYNDAQVISVIANGTPLLALTPTGNTAQSSPMDARYRLRKDGTQIIGEPNGARVEIKPSEDVSSITLYDGNSTPAITISNAEYTSIDELIGVGRQELIFNTWEYDGPNGVLRYGEAYAGNIYSEDIEVKAPSILHIPALTAIYDFNTAGGGFVQGVKSVEAIIKVKLNGEVIKTLQDIDAVGFEWQDRSTSEFEVNIPTGKHTLSFSIILAYTGSANTPTNPGADDVITCSVSVEAEEYITITPQAQATNIFTNGLSVVRNTSRFSVIHNDKSMEIVGECANYGVRVNNNAVQIKIGGSWYNLGIKNDTLTATKQN
jgi:hypothetical protein